MRFRATLAVMMIAGMIAGSGAAVAADGAKGAGGKGAGAKTKVDPQDVARARRGGGNRGPAGSKEEFIRRYDKNKNGKLDPEEAAVAQAERDAIKAGRGPNGGGQSPAGVQGPVNGGGPVDKKAARKQKKADKKAELLAKYDANSDGKLDAEERKAMKADQAAEKEAEREKKKAAKKNKNP